MRFLCHLIDHDDADQWTPIEADSSGEAAQKYARLRDEDSGGDLLTELPDVIRVKSELHSEIVAYEVGVSYEKSYYAMPFEIVEES